METALLQSLCLGFTVRCGAGGPCSDPETRSLKEFWNLQIWFSGMLPRSLHFYQGPCVILLHTKVWDMLLWFWWEMCPLCNVWKSKRKENTLLSPFKRNWLYHLAEWALSCRSFINLTQKTLYNLLPLNSPDVWKAEKDLRGVWVFSGSLFL